MANINCDLCGAEGAVLMQSNLGDGSTVAVGGACLLGFALGLAVGFSDDIPADVALAHMGALRDLIAHMAPELLPATPEDDPPKKLPRRRSTAADVSRETSPADGASNGHTAPDGLTAALADSLSTPHDTHGLDG